MEAEKESGRREREMGKKSLLWPSAIGGLRCESGDAYATSAVGKVGLV